MNTKRLHHRWDRADKRENVLFRREAHMLRDAEAFADQILAATDVEEPAMTFAECEAEAYEVNASDRAIAELRDRLSVVEPLADWERDLLGLGPMERETEEARVVWDSDSHDYEREQDEAFWATGDVEDDDYSSLEPWIAYCSIEEAREAFGGGDFIVQHTNVVRSRYDRRWS